MSDKLFKRVIRWRIRVRRLKLGKTQEDIADLAKMSVPRYQHFESGSHDFNPTFNVLQRLCKALDLKPEELLKEPSAQDIEASKRIIRRRAPRK